MEGALDIAVPPPKERTSGCGCDLHTSDNYSRHDSKAVTPPTTMLCQTYLKNLIFYRKPLNDLSKKLAEAVSELWKERAEEIK